MRWLFGQPAAAQRIWLLTLAGGGAPFVWQTLGALRRRQLAADVVASLAILVALAQGEYLAGVVIVAMLATGQALEAYSRRHASDALAALLARAPKVAHRRLRSAGDRTWPRTAPDDGRPTTDDHTSSTATVADRPSSVVEAVVDVPVEDVRPGDVLLVRPGELVPVDGVVVAGESSVDESALTGEPLPVARAAGGELRSGTINVEGALDVRATRASAESEYAQIVRLMETAQRERPAIQRVADRAAVWFTPFTLAAAAGVYALTGDVTRVLAVLVVATPCPLILATPVALISGINRAARHGIIVKSGAVIQEAIDVAVVLNALRAR